MAKLVLNDITSGYASITALNDNFALIENAFENTLSRAGTTPNQMQANLDMNGHLVINSGNPVQITGFTWEGPWTTGVLYSAGDIVESGGTSYICIEEHTAETFATDLSVGKWQVLANAPGLPTQTGQSGKYLYTNGSIASWEEVVGGSGSAPVKIAVLGDSFCVTPGAGANWTNYVSDLFDLSDASVEIGNFSNGGYTFYRANSNDPTYATFGGVSAVDRLIEFDPDIVIIALGFNDTIGAVDSRSLVDVIADATTVLNKIYTALPTAVYVRAREITFDIVNKPTAATLKNKHVIPYSQTNIISGTTGGALEANLEDLVSSAMQTKYDNWVSLDTHIGATLSALATTKYTSVNLDIWKPSRLGLSYDTLHLNDVGQRFLVADMWTFFRLNTIILGNVPSFTYLTKGNDYTIKDILWGAAVTASGDGWTYNTDSLYDRYVQGLGLDGYAHFFSWYIATKEKQLALIDVQGDLTFNLNDHTRPFILLATNCEPNLTVQYSLNGAAWANTGLITDRTGFGFTTSCAAATFKGLGLGTGNHTFQYRVGGYLSPVYTMTLTSAAYVYTGTAHTRIKTSTTTISTAATIVGTWVDTGLQITFTPTGGGRMISGSVNVGCFNTGGGSNCAASLRILKDGVDLQTFTDVVGYTTYEATHAETITAYIEAFDSDKTTTSKTYKIQVRLETDSGGTADAYVNGSVSGVRFSSMKIEEAEWVI